MRMRFANRTEAGKLLAKSLATHEGTPGLLVLALPRGGVPVAYEVARALKAPLDVFVVRKLGVPDNPELAMGAIASGGVRVLNDSVVTMLGLSPLVIDEVARRELRELERREVAYRNQRPPVVIRNRTVIVVDDGIATGSTMRAAIEALRQLNPARLIVATPTVAWATAEELRAEVDEFCALITPEIFNGVGEWYGEFPQTTDKEVFELLEKANRTLSRPAHSPRGP
jgi:putative phosphoribosyl transferase